MLFKPYLITLRNFQGFGNNTTEIRLDFEKPTLIIGRNYDSIVDGQLDSNGAGKTTILNALTYALFDTLISGKGVKQDDIINNRNKKDMLVELIFEVNGDFYKVQRFRKHKELGGTSVNVFKRAGGKWDDEFTAEHDVTTARDGSSKPDDAIKAAIGMSFEVFSRIVAFSASHTPFLTLPVSEQTEIVENIAGLSELTIDAEAIKKRSKADGIRLDSMKEVNQTIKVQREQIATQIQNAQTRADALAQDNLDELQTAKEELKALKGVDFEEQIAYFEYVAKVDAQILVHQQEIREDRLDLNSTKSTIEKIQGWKVQHDERLELAETNAANVKYYDFAAERAFFSKFDALEKQKTALSNSIRDTKREMNAELKIVAERDEELAHLRDSKCPYCTQQLQDAQKRTSLAMIARDNAQNAADTLQVTIDSLELDMGLIGNDIVTVLIDAKFGNEAEVNAAERKYQNAVDALERAKAEVNPYADKNVVELQDSVVVLEDNISRSEAAVIKKTAKRDEYKALLTYPNMQALLKDQARVDNINDRIERLSNFTNPLASVITDLQAVKLEDTKEDEIEKLESDIEHQQFLVKLLTKKDSFIRKTLLQKSLPFMNTRLRYYLDRIGLQHKVGFQEDLSVRISQFGNTIGFGILSSGQKARINIALAFTFRDMLQLRHGRLNFCILDECLDVGLGNVGVQLTAKMIKQVAQDEKLSMFIISHRDEIQNMFDRKVIVELRSGYSNIVEE